MYLCEQCESEGRHPRDHLLMRLYSPTITDIPVIRRIAKPHQGFCVMCHSPLSEEPIHQVLLFFNASKNYDYSVVFALITNFVQIVINEPDMSTDFGKSEYLPKDYTQQN